MNAVSSQSSLAQIFQSLAGKAPIRLSWIHYRIILLESNKEARDWYEQEAAREMWSTRTSALGPWALRRCPREPYGCKLTGATAFEV
ncbi:MAG: hypothetical protein IJP75_02200 [Bacteroidaceae bacterium]|nr:hypothetical protein [Bacteroidaceae bacterium]